MKRGYIVGGLIVSLLAVFIVLSNMNNKTEVELGNYLGLEVEYEDLVLENKDIEERYLSEIEAKVDFTEVKNRAVKNGDLVNIDFTGRIDGEIFEGGEAKGYDLEIGSNTFIEGFESKIVGMKIGDVRDIDLTFPKEYHNEEVSGKDVVFTITLNKIQTKVIPKKITNDFIKEITSDTYSTVKAFKDNIISVMLEEIENTNKIKKEELIWEQILENSKVKSLSQKEINHYRAAYQGFYENYATNFGVEFKDFVEQYLNTTLDAFNKERNEYAELFVKKYALSSLIAEENNIKVSNKEYNKYVEEYEIKDDDARENKKYIMNDLLLKKVNEFLVEKTTFK